MKKPFWLWLIIGAGLLLRLWQVEQLPAILNRDEAAVAYNAFLLMESGRDEWQRSWPLTLESFGDFKLPGYSVLLIPFLKIFGLQDWTVRLPSVLAGTVLIGLVYLLAKKLKLSETAALFTALLTAVSPVLVFYSRMAFEANVALTYFTGMLLVVLCLREQQRWWQYPLLLLLTAASVLTYNTPLLLLPVLMVTVPMLFHREQRIKLITLELIFGTVFLLALYFLLPAAAQKSGITIFTDETVWNQWTAFRASLPELWRPILGSRYAYYSLLAGKNIAASFSLDFLVLRGGAHPWHSLPTTGHLAALVYGLGIAGIGAVSAKIWAARKKLTQVRAELVLGLLFFASLLPAAVTVDAPHATRSLLFLLLFHIFAAFGAVWAVEYFFKQKQRKAWIVLLFLAIAEGALHAYQLFGLYPAQQAVFRPGFDTAVSQIEKEHPDVPVAIVDPDGYQYVLLAWYLQLPPEAYFTTSVRQQPNQIGFRYGERVGRYHFIARPEDRAENEPLLVQWSDQEQTWKVEEPL